MGTNLNPGKQSYQMAVNSEIFVDKTEMIMYLNSVVNTQQRYVSVSRPRRFGKTMAADMICAYYDREADSRGMFEGLNICNCGSVTLEDSSGGRKILSWDEYLSNFDVIRLVMTKFFKQKKTAGKALEDMQSLVIREIKKKYPDVDYFDDSDLIQTIDTSTYQNDMTTFTCRDDVLSLLIHLGYLGFDDERSEVFIPNKEILDEFITSTKVISLS